MNYMSDDAAAVQSAETESLTDECYLLVNGLLMRRVVGLVVWGLSRKCKVGTGVGGRFWKVCGTCEIRRVEHWGAASSGRSCRRAKEDSAKDRRCGLDHLVCADGQRLVLVVEIENEAGTN